MDGQHVKYNDMNKFKERYLELALEFASAKEKAFETRPIEKNIVSQNVKVSNAVRKKMDTICKKAKKEGYLSDIEEYMYHENKYIRCLTAMYYLFVDSGEAKKVLDDLTKLPIPNYVDASTILDAWRRGGMTME